MIFARKGLHEAAYKSFHPALKKQQNVSVADGLNELALQTSKRSGLPYYFVDQSQQVGTDFGTRLQNAFEQVLTKGYKHIIAIGNDCPDLNVEDIHKAKKAVENGLIALGPAEDGGVYLIGISQEEIVNGYLNHVEWNTARVYQQLVTKASNPLATLEPKVDIDFAIGRKVLTKGGKLLKMVWRWISQALSTPHIEVAIVSSNLVVLDGKLRRGPPMVS